MLNIYKAGAIVINNRKLLLTKTQGKDIFVCPGGKLEVGETAKQALVRELMEELQITISESNLQEFGSFSAQAAYEPDKQVTIDVFIVESWDGEIKPSNEIEEILWYDLSTSKDVKVGSIFEHHVIPKLIQRGLID